MLKEARTSQVLILFFHSLLFFFGENEKEALKDLYRYFNLKFHWEGIIYRKT